MEAKDSEVLKHLEHESRQACDYTEAILKTVPPLSVLDAALRVQTANESFYKHFRVAPSQTEGRLVYELGNGQWNTPKRRTFLEEGFAQFLLDDYRTQLEEQGINHLQTA